MLSFNIKAFKEEKLIRMEKHKIFVSYKYSDGRQLKDKIMKLLGDQGHIYKGERGWKELNVADNTIKEYLKDMIFDSSVTIVVISPKVRQSEWVDWEIRYSLTTTRRKGIRSKRNGLLCVIQNEKAFSKLGAITKNTTWARDFYGHLNSLIFPPSIVSNLQNTFGSGGHLLETIGLNEDYEGCEDYAIVVSEDTFLKNPNRYINLAFNRAQDYIRFPCKIRE